MTHRIYTSPAMLAHTTTVLSLTALARIAERHVREHGPADAEDVVDHLFLACGDRERAQAGVRLALLGQRITFDRDATVRTT